jgi:hypothetical protein
MKYTNPLMLGAVAALTLASAIACQSSTTGKEGNLEFRYDTDDEIGNFNKPIAIGASLDVRVYEAGARVGETNRDAEVLEVSSSDSSVLEVSKGGGNMFVVSAKGHGRAELTIRARVKSTGEEVEDFVDMMARKPERLLLSHTCRAAGTTDALYLPNQKIYLPFEMKMADGQDVIGYGYYPIAFDPPQALTILTNHKDQAFIHLEAGEVMGTVEVSSPVDASAKYALEFVQAAQIDGAALSFASEVKVGAGKTAILNVLPTIQSKPICQARVEFTVTTKTPEVCDVKKLAADAEEVQNGLTRQYGWLEVQGKMVGDCTFAVTYPMGNDGTGASADITVPVQNL